MHDRDTLFTLSLYKRNSPPRVNDLLVHVCFSVRLSTFWMSSQYLLRSIELLMTCSPIAELVCSHERICGWRHLASRCLVVAPAASMHLCNAFAGLIWLVSFRAPLQPYRSVFGSNRQSPATLNSGRNPLKVLIARRETKVPGARRLIALLFRIRSPSVAVDAAWLVLLSEEVEKKLFA